MSEEQFWNANPRIIKVWEESYKLRTNQENKMNYILGIYMYRALSAVIGPIFSKSGSNKKLAYPEEPVQLFPLTEKEKREAAEHELQRFIGWTSTVKVKEPTTRK